MFAGQVTVGASLSMTRTLNEHVSMLPLESVALQVTVFVPLGNTLSEGGVQTTEAPPQLSVALGAKLTRASHRPCSVLTTMFVGHVMTGFSRSTTPTVKPHETRLLEGSVAVQRTFVFPLGKRDPLGGTQTTVTNCELSEALTVKSHTASQRPTVVGTIRFLGQLMIGGSASLMVTVNEHWLVLPLPSVATQLTGVMPP